MAEKTADKKRVPIGLKCHASFVKKLDQASDRAGLNRSQFILSAVVEKLRALGVEILDWEAKAPSRKGKGGPKPRFNM